jgi:hypothetical protein
MRCENGDLRGVQMPCRSRNVPSREIHASVFRKRCVHRYFLSAWRFQIRNYDQNVHNYSVDETQRGC